MLYWPFPNWLDSLSILRLSVFSLKWITIQPLINLKCENFVWIILFDFMKLLLPDSVQKVHLYE